jgi:hypothetical protein
MDFLDVLTPIYGDWIDYKPLYIHCGHSGQFHNLNRTEEVVGSSPTRSTHEPPYVGVFILFDPAGGGISELSDCGENFSAAGCNRLSSIDKIYFILLKI